MSQKNEYLYTEESYESNPTFHKAGKTKRRREMRFEEFTDIVVEKIREYLPETFAKASVELKTVIKNNDLKLTGLTIRREESNICPTIYLEQYFKAYEAGKEMDKILEDIANVRVKTDVKDSFDVEQVTDFERVKRMVIPRLVSKEQNSVALAERPYSVLADLAVTYHILLLDRSSVSTPVTNDLMKVWGIETEELHELAVRNMTRLIPGTFRGMSVVMNALCGGKTDVLNPENEMLFVLSNEGGWYGAAAVLDDKFMKSVVERVGEEFYVLPSSVHELLVVPVNMGMDVGQLKEMVTSVNASEVALEEQLSDNVYRYSTEKGLQVAR